MSELVILGIGVTLLLTVAYIFSEDDFFSPSLIVCALFLVSVLFAIRDVIQWNVSDSMFTTNATIFLLLGLASFMVTEQITKAVLRSSKKRVLVVRSVNNRIPIHPSRIRLFLVLFLMIALVGYYCYMTYKYTAANGYEGGLNFSEIAAFRHANTFDSENSTQTSRLYRFSKYVIDANVFVCLWLLLRNTVYARDKVKKNVLYIVMILLSIPTCIINSSRGFILQIMGSGIFLFYIMMRRRNNWRKPGKIFKRILFWSTLILFFSVSLFYYVQAKGLFGRLTNRSLLDHVTMYIGDPILNFYDFVKNPPSNRIIYFGQETFAGLNNLFVRLHIRDIKYSVQLEFRNIQGHEGNIYTFFRRPLRDFGVVGMCIVTSLTSFLFTYIYYKKLYKKSESYVTDITLIIYSYFFYIIYLFPMLCQLCNMVYFGMVYFVFFIYLFYRFLLGKGRKNILRTRSINHK